ncbi:hypothetical protein DBV05_g1807 [Lasiodiplodia theobromae]|uniref:AA1-like domain-containing protein n=1 Tax=Lasiodiplodia theobromae TaxID=45133 RepID=A0A5N5DP63_9PEZI|nr:hypothetical protein DBV05_g1807 [Lasiodiplodia theobromae]
MHHSITTLFSLLLSFIPLLALLPTLTTAVPAFEAGWHILNLTHIPVRSTGTDVCNGSISFTLAKGNRFASRVCSHTFIASTDEQAAGGPFTCSDDWPDFTYYWREDNGDDDEEQSTGIAAATAEKGSNVMLDIWFAYLDCRPNGGAVSESGKLTLPPPTTTGTFAAGSRTWNDVYVAAETISSTAWFPGQYEEVCLSG